MVTGIPSAVDDVVTAASAGADEILALHILTTVDEGRGLMTSFRVEMHQN